MHQNEKPVIYYVVFPFFWSMSGGTEPKLDSMLDFSESAKATESSKPHIFLIHFKVVWYQLKE